MKLECHFKIPDTIDQPIDFSSNNTRLHCWTSQIESQNNSMFVNKEGQLIETPKDSIKDIAFGDSCVCTLVNWEKAQVPENPLDGKYRIEAFKLTFDSIPKNVRLFELQMDFISPKLSTLFSRNEDDNYFLQKGILKLLY